MTNTVVANKVMENFIQGKHPKGYLVTVRYEEYGGTILTILFHDPPSGKQLSRAVNEITSAPFGFGVRGGRLNKDVKFQVKVYND